MTRIVRTELKMNMEREFNKYIKEDCTKKIEVTTLARKD